MTLLKTSFIALALFVSANLFALEKQVAMVKPIAEKANLVSPILIGETIPDVTLFDSSGTPINLRKEAAKKPTILVFYRGGWCPFCNAQLSQIKTIEKDIAALGYQLLAISPDTPDALMKTSKGKELGYRLISDFNLMATKAFGLGFYIPDNYSMKIKGKGWKTQSLKGDSRSVLPVPAVFVLDRESVIQFEYINPNFKVRIEPEMLLLAAKLALKEK